MTMDYAFLFENLGNLAEVSTTALAVSITVVAIIVQLAATRYSPKISDLFLKNGVNVAVMVFFIFIIVFNVWIMVPKLDPGSEVQRTIAWSYLVLLTLSFVVIIPYLFFVFRFLQPDSIIRSLEDAARDHLQSAREKPLHLGEAKRKFLETVEQIGDIGVKSIASMDRSLGLSCVGALKRILVHYLVLKRKYPTHWYSVGPGSFYGFSADSIARIEQSRTWAEMAVLKQYEFILATAVGSIREMIQEISNAMGEIAETAAGEELAESVELVVAYFNTFLRIGHNAKDQYGIFNLLNQYRNFAEHMMNRDGRLTLEIAGYFRYYGLLAVAARLPFIMITVSSDLRVLNERALERGFEQRGELLDIFLTLDKEPETAVDEIAFLGVRKSQAILAGFYLGRGETELARHIWRDMAHEPPERLAAIRDEILALDRERYWEVTDRWINFDYVPPEQKERIREFFSWFGESKIVRT
jgi:hypothetical protein